MPREETTAATRPRAGQAAKKAILPENFGLEDLKLALQTSGGSEESGDAPAALFRWVAGEKDRKTLFPLKHHDIWEFRKTIGRLKWTADEVDTSRDRSDWESRMNDDDRHPVKYSLGLFAIFDNKVLKNLPRVSDAVDCLEAECFYAGQEDQEADHMEAYMLQIEAVARNEEEKAFMLNSIETMPGVALLDKWATHWMDKSLPFEECYVAFAIIEGVIFSGFFCILQWLRERNLLPGVTDFNAFIARDEGIHALFACMIIKKYMINRPRQSRVNAIAKSAIKTVSVMINEALPKPLPGINAELVRQYVRFQADCTVRQMGYDILFRVKNPFKFMDRLTMNSVAKYNFFERRPNQYQGSAEGAAVWKIDRSPIPE